MLLVFHPAIGAVLAAKPIFQSVDAVFEGARNLGLDSRKVFGVDSGPPEIGILEIFTRVVPKHSLDVVADKCGSERSPRLEAVDHGGGRNPQNAQKAPPPPPPPPPAPPRAHLRQRRTL